MPLERRAPSPEEEGRALVERLGGRWTAAGGMCRCPAHEDRTPSLSVRPGRERLLLHCFAGCRPGEILRALQSERLIDPSARGTVDPLERRSRNLNRAALGIWSAGRPIAGTAAGLYLKSRGLDACSPELRYHPRAPHGARPSTEFRPAMIAAVRDDRGLVAVHRTFIAPGGRGLAPLPAPRRGLGRFAEGAVRLGGTANRLGLAEGIETALSASALFGMPCWATLGTERFGTVAIPGEVEEIHLFLDHDPGGRRAEALARRAFGRSRRIEAHCPERPGDDWNDVLRASLQRT